jgi:hypothetical protein
MAIEDGRFISLLNAPRAWQSEQYLDWRRATRTSCSLMLRAQGIRLELEPVYVEGGVVRRQ